MTVPDRSPITSKLVQWLEDTTNEQVGDCEAPPIASITPGHPWIVVWPIPGGGFDGPPMATPEADAAYVYQIDSVGLTRAQAEWMADKIRRTMLARSAGGSFQVQFPDTGPVKVIQRVPDSSPAGVVREGEPDHYVYTVPDRYVLHVTPS